VLTEPAPIEERTDPGTVFSPHTNAPDRPIIILPGIGGSFASNDARDEWFTERGIEPEKLQIDALGQYYDDLITTLRAVGYTLNVDLFIGNYDWRMNPGPIDPALLDADTTNDVFDGTLTGLTGASIADSTFEYGVDYLGFWLKQASNAWLAAHGSRPTDVDIVAHSTGGIVARAYIQSGAYGDVTGTGAGDFALPKIHDLIMVGVPNRGASKAYNVLQDDWNGEPAFALVLSKVVNEAWQRLINPLDPDYTGYISGPDYDIVGPLCVFGITCDDDPNPSNTNKNVGFTDYVDFVSLYIPTARGLLATYAFLDQGSGLETVNTVMTGAGARNALLLDLNSGLDVDFTIEQLNQSANHTVEVTLSSGTVTRTPNAFIDKLTGSAVIVFGDLHETPMDVKKHTGPGTLENGEDSGKELQPFRDFVAHVPGASDVWYEDIARDEGDSTVPVISATGMFAGDKARLANGKITINRFTAEMIDCERPTELAGILQKGDVLDHTGTRRIQAAA